MATNDEPELKENDVALGVIDADGADDATAVAGNKHSEDILNASVDVEDVNVADEVAQAKMEALATSESRMAPTEDTTAAAEVKVDDNSSNAQKPTASTGQGSQKTSAFRQLVKSWESYIADSNKTDSFQPMQVLQSLGMCGTSHHDVPKLMLAPSVEFANQTEDYRKPFEPIILRHTHSTPLQYRPSLFQEYDNNSTTEKADNSNDVLPPPSQLDSTRRSSSTPSRGSAFQSFSARSSYGTLFHSSSNVSGRSAFGFPLQRSSFSGVSTESNIRGSAFNPVNVTLSPHEEEPPQGEDCTSIEVMDLGRPNPEGLAKPASQGLDESEEKGEVEVQLDPAVSSGFDDVKPKKSAKARAARFFSEVGVLRRKKKSVRGGLISVISCDQGAPSMSANLEEPKDDEKQSTLNHDLILNKSQESDSSRDGSAPMYQQLDSDDVDDEFDRYQSIENTGHSSDDSSPRTIPSPAYQPMNDVDHLDSVEDQTIENKEIGRPAVRIHVSCAVSRVSPIDKRLKQLTINDVTTQCPTDQSGSPRSSTESPGDTTRSSATLSTSGHTTQATSTTSVTNVSETDREVMEAIKEGKRRRRQEKAPEDDKHDSDGNRTIESSSSNSSGTNGYTTLNGSPGPLRDGASVVADRFFQNSQSPIAHGGYPSYTPVMSTITSSLPSTHAGAPVRARTQTMPYKGSPMFGSNLHSIDEKPPTFVSYLERTAASDLTSLRGAPDAASCRVDREEREDSPAQIVGYPAAFIAEASAAADGQENTMSVLPKLVIPVKESFYNIIDKFRSLPPRTPTKGMRSMTPTTPPPRIASPAFHQRYSPPRNASRPYVVRTNPTTQKHFLVSPGTHVRPITPLVCIPIGSPSYSPNQNRPLATLPEQSSPFGFMFSAATYEEHNIEILKTDSRDELLDQRVPTPEVSAGGN